MKKQIAAIYVRVSTDAQAEEGYSIEAQKEQLAAYCVAKQIKDYEFYIDGGWSGSNIERPALQRLITDAKNGRISHCLVYKLDRLSRSQKDTLYLIEDVFIPNNIDFISLNENVDTSTPYGKTMIGILSSFAQLERETIFLRTRMGMLERVKLGYWMGGGRVPFGYDYDQANGILVPNRDADKVRAAYNLFLEGYPMQRIANMLGLKYEKLVSQILTRKTNIGIIEYKGNEYQGLHEPLISEEIYNKTMLEIERRSKPFTGGNKLLTGLLVCGHCGAKMRYQKWGKNGDKLVCYSQHHSKPYLIKDPNCTQPKLWASDIEDIVVNDLMEMSIQKTKQKQTENIDQLTILKNEQLAIEAKNMKLYNLYAERDDDILLKTIEGNKKKLVSIMRNIRIIEIQRENQKQEASVMETLEDIQDYWKCATIQQKKSILHSVIDSIIVNDNSVTINYRI